MCLEIQNKIANHRMFRNCQSTGQALDLHFEAIFQGTKDFCLPVCGFLAELVIREQTREPWFTMSDPDSSPIHKC